MARPRKRSPLEDGLKLDLNLLRRQMTVQSGPVAWAPISWDSRYPAGAPLSGLVVWHFSSATRGSIRLFLGELSQTIDLVAAQRYFGGAQWYFVCPILRQRASVLWLPPGASCFASRRALGSQFAYASQFESAPLRALSRARQICRRLGDRDYISVFGYPLRQNPEACIATLMTLTLSGWKPKANATRSGIWLAKSNDV